MDDSLLVGPEEFGPHPSLYAGWLKPEAVRLKYLDDALNEAGGLVERFNNWRASKGSPLTQCYVRSYSLTRPMIVLALGGKW